MENPTYYTGIDLHKRTAYLTTVDGAGSVAGQKKLPCRRKALREYFGSFERGSQHEAAVETTTGWYWVADLLSGEGVDLKLAHAKYLKAISYAKVSGRQGRFCHARAAPALRDDSGGASDRPRPARSTRYAAYQADLGGTALERPAARVKTLLQKLNARCVEELPALYQAQARCHQGQADLLKTQIKSLERELHPRLVPDGQVQRLLWIPGVGKTVAFTLRLEVGTIERFPTAGQFFSYCRLVPGASDSGSSRAHSHSKDGNKYLKLAFSHASVRAIQYYPVIRSFYERKLSRKPEAIARAIVSKEIARIVYHVLRKREDFNGCFKGTTMSRQKKPNWPRLPRPRTASPTV